MSTFEDLLVLALALGIPESVLWGLTPRLFARVVDRRQRLTC